MSLCDCWKTLCGLVWSRKSTPTPGRFGCRVAD
nr:MAG TPA: hypothetical protein [Caudoviricetes sp.]